MQASLVQQEQCPGTCPAARRLKAQLVSKELEIQKLKETVSTVQDENEKLKEGQQDHHNVVEVAKRVAQEMSLNLLNKLPSCKFYKHLLALYRGCSQSL